MQLVVNGKRYPVVTRFTFAEARAIEKVTGMRMAEARKAASEHSALAMQAFYWVAIKRVDPTTKFADLDEWVIDDIDVDTDDAEERRALVAAAAEAGVELPDGWAAPEDESEAGAVPPVAAGAQPA